MTTEIEDKSQFDTEIDLLIAATAEADEMEAKAVKMLATLGLTPDPKMTAVRQVVMHLQADLLASFKRGGILERLQLQPGDLVRLKSGGPVMVVEGVEECEVHGQTCQSGCRPPAVVHCTWFVDRENVGKFAQQVQSYSFTAEALVKVGGKSASSVITEEAQRKAAWEAAKIPGVYKIVEPDASVSVHVWGKGSEKNASGIAEQLRHTAAPITATRIANGVKTVTSTCVQVEPGQSVAEVAEVGKGRPVVIGSNGELIKPLTRAEEIELRFQQFAEIKASPESVK